MGSLDRIKISGFKSIRELDLELRPLNVLIGANGAGKSNFIQLFSLLNALVDERLQNFVARAGGATNLLYFGRKTT
ncbi:MAG TPA: AAA family ATPase, partial [Aggregatilineaceae bacterium]|nr:AAA family ATPase [Aggregatilineaceae bacterium]